MGLAFVFLRVTPKDPAKSVDKELRERRNSPSTLVRRDRHEYPYPIQHQRQLPTAIQFFKH
jgi:hypothetical protein